jgi:CYTH domain-containing protein/CHAD domain-containing protein
MAKETERRFLVRSDAWRKLAGSGVHYLQGYLSTDSKRNVRIRIGGNEAKLTIKGEAEGITRPEFEYPIPLDDGKDLERICLKPILEKTRYTLKHDGLTWEIDEYSGENAGLIVAEVETKSEAPLRKTPGWLGPEISGDHRYSNSNLVEQPFATWTQDQQKPDTRYFLQAGEKLPDGLRRILNEQLNAAVAELSTHNGSLDNAVHEARKCVKRTRSVLRLIRPVSGSAYSRENQRLRAAGRNLSELRDAQALIETLQNLEAYPPAKKKTAYSFLQRRKEKILRSLEASGEIKRTAKSLEQSLKSINRLPLQKVDFSVIIDSLAKSVKRGRDAFSKAYADPKPENFHEYRKRVKDLRYQLGVLTELWPDVLEGYANSAKELEQSLGEDHNLAVLAGVLPQNHFQAGIAEAQAKLRDQAKQLSSRLYAEPPKAWTRRLESSWKAWLAENGK